MPVRIHTSPRVTLGLEACSPVSVASIRGVSTFETRIVTNADSRILQVLNRSLESSRRIRPGMLLFVRGCFTPADHLSRVGSGPFPSESIDEWGERLQTIGKEFGVTTGRKRRCGWLDLNVVKYSAAINSYTAINLTKLDILDTFPEIKIAVSYRHPVTQEKIEGFSADLDLLEKVEVEYVVFKGWLEPIGHCRSFSELPPAVRNSNGGFYFFMLTRSSSVGNTSTLSNDPSG